MANKRREVWIDRFQTNLTVRIAIYLILYQASVVSTFFVARVLFADFVTVFGLPVPGYLLVVVILGAIGAFFIYDAITYSHRIVGPIVRFRRAIQDVIAGDETGLMELRKNDALHDLKDEFNEMLRVLEKRGAIHVKASDHVKTSDKANCVTSS